MRTEPILVENGIFYGHIVTFHHMTYDTITSNAHEARARIHTPRTHARTS